MKKLSKRYNDIILFLKKYKALYKRLQGRKDFSSFQFMFMYFSFFELDIWIIGPNRRN